MLLGYFRFFPTVRDLLIGRMLLMWTSKMLMYMFIDEDLLEMQAIWRIFRSA